jgi:hypothetical protein
MITSHANCTGMYFSVIVLHKFRDHESNGGWSWRNPINLIGPRLKRSLKTAFAYMLADVILLDDPPIGKITMAPHSQGV